MSIQENSSADTKPQENQFSDYSLGELGEVIQGSCHVLGTVSGQQTAARMLRLKAGELFANKKDEIARFCRDLADEISAVADVGRKDYDALSHPRERAAFEELDRRELKGGAQ